MIARHLLGSPRRLAVRGKQSPLAPLRLLADLLATHSARLAVEFMEEACSRAVRTEQGACSISMSAPAPRCGSTPATKLQGAQRPNSRCLDDAVPASCSLQRNATSPQIPSCVQCRKLLADELLRLTAAKAAGKEYRPPLDAAMPPEGIVEAVRAGAGDSAAGTLPDGQVSAHAASLGLQSPRAPAVIDSLQGSGGDATPAGAQQHLCTDSVREPQAAHAAQLAEVRRACAAECQALREQHASELYAVSQKELARSVLGDAARQAVHGASVAELDTQTTALKVKLSSGCVACGRTGPDATTGAVMQSTWYSCSSV